MKLKVNMLEENKGALQGTSVCVFQDNRYLKPYIEEVARERREKEEWKKK